jgi:hypothetical protein
MFADGNAFWWHEPASATTMSRSSRLGYSLSAISRELTLDHSTMRRFANATRAKELLVKAVNRTGKLDRYKPHLNQRWNEGCTDAAHLHVEIQALGRQGSEQPVRRYVHPFLATLTPPPAALASAEAAPGNPIDHDKARQSECRRYGSAQGDSVPLP